MKIAITEKPKEQEIKYPCLMKSDNGMIVFFEDSSSGIVLAVKDHHS